MCRANRIYKNKLECNIYLWCSEKKTTKILGYLFEKTDGCIENKIFRIDGNSNNKNTIIFTNRVNHIDEVKNLNLLS